MKQAVATVLLALWASGLFAAQPFLASGNALGFACKSTLRLVGSATPPDDYDLIQD